MSNENEEILQVLSLFRHGKRNSFMNFETNEEYSTDLCEDSLITTINKGKKFIDKYFTKFPASPFNSKDFKCYISDSIRTIKSIIYRLIDLIPKLDFKSMKYQELKEYTLKNIPNAIYDDKIFKSYEYCDKISAYYCFEDPNYKDLFEEIEREISKKSEKALEVYKKYLKHPIFEGNTYAYFKICFISDFLFFITPEVQKNFNEEQVEFLFTYFFTDSREDRERMWHDMQQKYVSLLRELEQISNKLQNINLQLSELLTEREDIASFGKDRK